MMKKFLSSLLALTMILSLVIVPANAANAEIEGVSVSADSIKLNVGGSTILKVNIPNKKSGDTLKIGGEDAKLQSDITLSGVTSSDPKVATVEVDKSSNNVTVTAADQGTATITYTVSCNYKNKWDLNTSATQTLTTEVTVEPEVTAASGVVTVSTATTNVKEGDDVVFTVIAKIKDSKNNEHNATVTDATWSHNGKFDKAKGTLTVKAPASDFTVSATGIKLTASDNSNLSLDDSAKIKVNASKVSVTSNQSEANKAFDTAVKVAKAFTYNSRPATLTGSTISYTEYASDSKTGADAIGFSGTIEGYTNIQVVKVDATHVKVTAKPSSGDPKLVESTQFVLSSTTPSVTFTNSLTSGEGFTATVQKDGTITVTAKASNVTNPSYEWVIGKKTVGTEAGFTFNKENKYTATKGTVTAVCKVHENGGSAVAAQATFTLTVSDEACTLEVKPEKLTFAQTGSSNYQTLTAKLYKTENNKPEEVKTGVTYSFKASDDSVIGFSKSSNPARVYLKKQDNATITVTATFEGKTYTETVEVKGTLLNASLDKVENGGNLEFDYNDLEKAANEALPGRVTVNDDKPITLSDIPTRDSDGGMIYDSNHKVTGNCSIDDDDDDLEFRAANGFVGDAKMTMTVTGDDGKTYVIALAIPVTMREAKFDDQVTGGESSYKVSVPDGYKAYSVLGVNKAPDSDKYNKTWTIRNAEYSGSSLYSVKSTDLKDGEVKLYIVAIDSDGKAYAGTLTVTANSYSIKYNVVAGESVTFDQKRFESFMEDYADDNIKTSKGDYFEFDYVKFTSLPNSTREGVLYEGKDKIKTSTEVEDLDKVTFESVAKAKDTIKVPFTLYAKQYDKNDKVIDKKVSMTGEVVISVVKEDIVFEVGVNSAVKLGSDKFIDFLRDSDKSYKKADLDYVTFDVGKNSAITSYFNGTGALYRYYNGSTGVNSTVSAKDEFYYNPKTSSKHYDLDDVAYVTSKFAKVGDIVYIPFTAYGTKSGQKAEGTIAIKVKQTMNFVDVRPGDYFYDSVQWAVNLDITKGTSATTFSPKQGCTRAQIVTFLWRAANSPAPRSSTSKFTDVYATAHADYMKAINWATEQGITTGTGNGKFSPDATCTRAQIVTFLYRFKGNPAVYGSLNFSDVNKTEHAAFYNAILWAVNNKITTGYGNGIFDPNGTCNRGDAVTFLYRALA